MVLPAFYVSTDLVRVRRTCFCLFTHSQFHSQPFPARTYDPLCLGAEHGASQLIRVVALPQYAQNRDKEAICTGGRDTLQVPGDNFSCQIGAKD